MHYGITDKIGTDDMGVVWRVFYPRLDNPDIELSRPLR
jgi:hypothetical protein